MNENQKSIIIEGDPIDGFSFTGPFDTFDDAVEYAERFRRDWYIASLDESKET